MSNTLLENQNTPEVISGNLKFSNINPFKSSLLVMYKFKFLKNGLKVIPIHHFRYLFTLFVWLFAFGLIAFTVSDILGYPRLGALFMLPGAFLCLVGIARMWNDFLFTYGSQIINSITIYDGIVTLEVLDDSGYNDSYMHMIRTFLSIPKRNVVDTLDFPISSILSLEYEDDEINGFAFCYLIASIAVLDDNDDPSIVEIPMSPRLSTPSALKLYEQIITLFMSIDNESE